MRLPSWGILMQLVKVFGIAISLLMLASVLKAQTPTIEELSDDITAFLCEDDSNVANLPFVFIESKSGWTLSGFSKVSVTKNKKGFMIKFPSPNEGIGLLSEAQNNYWKYEYLGEKGSWETVCSLQNTLTHILIEKITPKIVEYANSISLLEYEELITANDKIKSLTIDLAKSYNELERKYVASANAAIRHEEEMAKAAERHKKEMAIATDRHEYEMVIMA